MRYFVTSLALAVLIGLAPTLALGAAAPNAAAKPIALHANVTVKGEIVRLGDLFRNVGVRAGIAVAYAPDPGKTAVLDAEWLAETARRHGIAWRPKSPLDRLVLRRASRQIEGASIARRITTRLRKTGLRGEIKVKLDLGVSTIHLPVGAGKAFAIRELRYNERSGRLAAQLVAPARNPTYSLRITGRLQRLIKVAVLSRRLRRGDIVRARDVAVRSIDRARVPTDALTRRDELVGLAARRALPSGAPLRNGDLQAPTLVRRGALVTLEINTATIRLTARGKALDNGVLGDTVRIRNIQSKRVVQGTVVGMDRVRIALAGSLAAR
jgi:flagella basal body P-ring formation protein FlgA